MTQHTDLIERLRKGVDAMDDCSDGVALIKCDALMSAGANALEAQAREIAELKAQEAELCTLYGLAQAECQKLRKDAALVAARERERCALVALNEPRVWDLDAPDPQHRIAAAIRALNTEGDGHDRS